MLEFLIATLASLLAGDWLMLLLTRIGLAGGGKPVVGKGVAIAPALAKRVLKRLRAHRQQAAGDPKDIQRLDQDIEQLASATKT